MKKQILISLIMFCSVWSANAQWSGTSPVWTNSNVGIGTTSPYSATKLDIRGNIGYGENLTESYIRPSSNAWGGVIKFRVDGNTPNRYVQIGFQNNSGVYSSIAHFDAQTENVGIGTSTPSARLELYRGTNETLKIDRQSGYASVKATSSNNGWLILDSYGSGSGGVSLNHYVTDNVYLAIGGGKVGIGTSTPTEKLEINGSIKVAKAANGYDFSKCGLIVQNSTQTDNVSVNSIALATSTSNNYGYTINAARTTSGNGSLDIRYHFNNAVGTSRFFLSENGSVGIGTTSPAYKLAVKGSIGCSEVQVLDVSGWSDFVFAPDYTLRSLSEVETFINQNQHLPDVPSEKEVKANGYDVSEMNAVLLQKIEELTLYMIEQEKKDIEQQNLLEKQQKEIESVKAENRELKFNTVNTKELDNRIEKLEELINQLSK